jgi:hypothetical protein
MYDIVAEGLDAIFNAKVGFEGTVMDAGDFKRCVIATHKLMRFRPRVLGFLLDNNNECEDEGCPEERFRRLQNSCRSSIHTSDVELLVGGFGWSDYDLCGPCLTRAKRKYKTARQALWNDLPSIFNLPAWDVLLAPGVPE